MKKLFVAFMMVVTLIASHGPAQAMDGAVMGAMPARMEMTGLMAGCWGPMGSGVMAQGSDSNMLAGMMGGGHGAGSGGSGSMTGGARSGGSGSMGGGATMGNQSGMAGHDGAMGSSGPMGTGTGGTTSGHSGSDAQGMADEAQSPMGQDGPMMTPGPSTGDRK